VEGNDTCIGTDGKPYPCTRYGYRYGYSGATAGTQIECTATRRDPFNKRQKTYTVAINAESGSVVQAEWIPHGPVDRRTMLPEEDRTAITVVTGIQGPPDGAGRPMELLAHYHLREPTRTHQQRLSCLLDLARKSLDLWMSKVEADNTVQLPNHPENFRPTCPVDPDSP
jgi:hypothetical protein